MNKKIEKSVGKRFRISLHNEQVEFLTDILLPLKNQDCFCKKVQNITFLSCPARAIVARRIFKVLKKFAKLLQIMP